jgi:hypothetical protein
VTPSFFFIVGSPRSGTSLLRWMLDSHPDIAVTPDMLKTLPSIWRKRSIRNRPSWVR